MFQIKVPEDGLFVSSLIIDSIDSVIDCRNPIPKYPLDTAPSKIPFATDAATDCVWNKTDSNCCYLDKQGDANIVRCTSSNGTDI